MPILTLLRTSRAAQIGLGALVLAVLVGALWLRGNSYRNQRDEARVALTEQVAEYRRVYNETFARHFAAKIAEDARLQSLKTEADNATAPLRQAALDDATRYRDAHRCVLAPAARTDPGGAVTSGLSSPATDPGSAAQPAAPAELVGITTADHDACSLNTADLWVAYRWAQGLNPPAP